MTRRIALVLAALGLVGACSSDTSSRTVTHLGTPMPSYATQVAERNRATVAYAEQLAGRAPRIAGEQPLATPPSDLERPGEAIGVSTLVVRARYWTVPGSPDGVYRALKKTSPKGLRLSGWGRPSLSAETTAGRGFLHWDPESTPPYVEDVELYVELQRYSATRSIIAAFGEVVAHPVRQATEHIAAAGSTATATWPRIENDKVVAHRVQRLTDEQVRGVVAGFDRAPVAAPATCFGAFRLSGDVLVVTIRSAGHTWKLTYPGTSCYDLGVTRDGVELPALEPGAAFRHLLRVLSHGGGTIVGHLALVGGPAGAINKGIPGTVTLIARGETFDRTHTRSANGYFLVSAPPGTYELVGSSVHYEIDGRPGRCMSAHPVTIVTDQTTHADIYCQRR